MLFIQVILASIIGALPFGLVNLSVMNIAYRTNARATLQTSLGATWIEIIYALGALYFGHVIQKALGDNAAFQMLFVIVPIIIGLMFFFKQVNVKQNSTEVQAGHVHGMLLNLLSVQVLLYWVLAMSFIQHLSDLSINSTQVLLIASAVFIGKMGVLFFYAKYTNFVFNKFKWLSKNIYRFIGIVLIFIGVLQIFKY